MDLKSEVIILSDRVILNIITENPYELLEKMKSFLRQMEIYFRFQIEL